MDSTSIYPTQLSALALPPLQAACNAKCRVKSATRERESIGLVVAHQLKAAGSPSKYSL